MDAGTQISVGTGKKGVHLDRSLNMFKNISSCHIGIQRESEKSGEEKITPLHPGDLRPIGKQLTTSLVLKKPVTAGNAEQRTTGQDSAQVQTLNALSA